MEKSMTEALKSMVSGMTPAIRKISAEDWLAEGVRLFGEDPKLWRFVCPNCKNVQTIADFLELRKAGIKVKDAQVAYFNCIGRYDTRISSDKIGTMTDKKKPCNYTLGGLLRLVKTVVLDDEGKEHPVFEFETPSDREESEGEDGEGGT